MSPLNRARTALKALHQLGPQQVGLYAAYQLGLRSGHYRRLTPPGHFRRESNASCIPIRTDLLQLPDHAELGQLLGADQALLIHEADEILEGKARLFGSKPAPINLEPNQTLYHWSDYEIHPELLNEVDVKILWEPARFTWAYTLSRAYHLTTDERYAQAFWKFTEIFLTANPVNLGPNWISAQEVAIRLIALTFAIQIFSSAPSSTTERIQQLARAIADHAARIPPTLSYARAQNNNHLLSEAAGLFTAGMALQGYTKAEEWLRSGWRWLMHGFQSQIAENGTYVQHSTNYHRLMLQLALWVSALSKPFPEQVVHRLGAAARWLLLLTDFETGQAVNLGHNDGAYVQPLTICPYNDYRPVLQAACLSFLGEHPFPDGAWDELSLWMGRKNPRKAVIGSRTVIKNPSFYTGDEGPHILRINSHSSWAYMRVARFISRPAHVDQLHLDLWWHGMNLARDAGTYLYNASPPWDNCLALTDVHNTLTVDDLDQMTHAGRFLWLDWAQAEVVFRIDSPDGSCTKLVARHNGYDRIGVIHQRSVKATPSGHWIVEDHLRSKRSNPPDMKMAKLRNIRLHWLLPDWPWEIVEDKDGGKVSIHLTSPTGSICLQVECPRELNPAGYPSASTVTTQLVRAGELLHGTGSIKPTWGWVSPTYGQRTPALSFAYRVHNLLPVLIRSEWILP